MESIRRAKEKCGRGFAVNFFKYGEKFISSKKPDKGILRIVSFELIEKRLILGRRQFLFAISPVNSGNTLNPSQD